MKKKRILCNQYNRITCYNYIDMTVLLENYTTHKIHKSYTCDLSGFIIFHNPTRDFLEDIISVISLYQCLCNKMNITNWQLEDMNFISLH